MDMINKIKEEGTKNSKVMDIAFHLTDVSGPRLTASPGFMRAANWAKEELTKMGLVNANLEPWGEFGKRLAAGTLLCSDDLHHIMFLLLLFPVHGQAVHPVKNIDREK